MIVALVDFVGRHPVACLLLACALLALFVWVVDWFVGYAEREEPADRIDVSRRRSSDGAYDPYGAYQAARRDARR